MNRDLKPGEFIAGITMPPAIHGLLRKRVMEIECCDTAVNCLIAQARAESLVEGLEVLKALEADAIERLYLVVEEAARKRLDELRAK
ncbi:hypothetical protein [Pseudomonas urethralis]|uniref:hypothetical protein n=1 Tax=Pseudomonas urethralis TaxID=2740517 RepID=UPI001F232EA0|nr:hypothetical protein [Pseudomonas urethralis]